MVKLMIGLYYGCHVSDPEVIQGEARHEALLEESQGGVHDRPSPWKSKGR